jgi:hypothetical protein
MSRIESYVYVFICSSAASLSVSVSVRKTSESRAAQGLEPAHAKSEKGVSYQNAEKTKGAEAPLR